MPAVLTHHFFGLSVLESLGSETFASDDEREAFLLGNQGPDPLFYAVFTRDMVAIKQFGSRLHADKVAASLDCMRAYTRRLPEPQQKVVDAYMCGFLCHFALDATAHPFVFAQERALCTAGVPGLDMRDRSEVHGQIETDLDAMMLKQRRGQTLRDMAVERSLLFGRDEVLHWIDGLYVQVAREVFGITLPPDVFWRGVHDMRTSYRVLRSPTGMKRALLGMVERALPGRRHSLAQAMSHRTDVGETCDFDNREHLTWKDPATGEERSETFAELFAAALNLAKDNLRLHEEGAPSAFITGGRTFEGRFEA